LCALVGPYCEPTRGKCANHIQGDSPPLCMRCLRLRKRLRLSSLRLSAK